MAAIDFFSDLGPDFGPGASSGKSKKQQQEPQSLDQVIVKVTDMISWDHTAQKLAKAAGYNVQMVSWEGPCISDMTLRVKDSMMPVIRLPNFSDKTWDVKMKDIPIVIGNESAIIHEKLQTISLSDYLSNFSDFMSNDHYGWKKEKINLLNSKENGDSHVIMSSQACFLPIIRSEETKFNVALYNYQSQPKNPAVLVIVSTAKGASAQIIEGREQHLLFNNNGKKADFVGERVSDVRIKKGQKNVHDKVLSTEEKQDNVIVIVQVPLQKRVMPKPKPVYHPQSNNMNEWEDCFGSFASAPNGMGGPQMYGGGGNGFLSFGAPPPPMMQPQSQSQCAPQMEFCDSFSELSMPSMEIQKKSKKKKQCRKKGAKSKPNVEAAMVSVSERTKPVCKCGAEFVKIQMQNAYNGTGVQCDECGKSINDKEVMIYHCPKGKSSYQHPNGYDLCIECGDKQLKFDELRGLLDTVKDYKLKRDERYPVRVTLQYYKATDNGAVDKEIMDDIFEQLEASQKQADFMGSLVNEYDRNRPTEWIKKPVDDIKVDDPIIPVVPLPMPMPIVSGGDEYAKIRAALMKHCGKEWMTFLQNFENEEVKDADLKNLEDDDLKELITKMGPRKRFLNLKLWTDRK